MISIQLVRAFQYLSLFLGGIFIVGCASYNTELRNASGEVSHCQNVGWGWLGTPIAVINQHRCESAMRERGFVPVDSSKRSPAMESAVATQQRNSSDVSQASKSDSAEKIKIPDAWIKLTIPDATAKNGAVLWLKRQSPDIYIAVSTLPGTVESDLAIYSRTQQQGMTKDVLNPEVSPISSFDKKGIQGNLMHVVGTPSNAKKIVRTTAYVFRKNASVYRLEISQLESEYFLSRDAVDSAVESILGGL